ncbi:steroid 17-alpha-hydroxylase/17,20 lyase-like isoform X2 [Clytia hemisphaerica]
MKRVVVLNSYESIKEALIQKTTELAGRPQDSIPMKIATYNNKALGIMDYNKKFVFMRKLAYKSLHLYGSGMTKIEEKIVAGIEEMCSMLCKEVDKPIFIRQHLAYSLVNTICHLCFSKKYDSHDPEFQNLLQAIEGTNVGLGLDQAITVFPWLRFFPDSKALKNLKTSTVFIHGYIHRMFEEHKQTLNGEKIRDITDSLLYLSQNKEQWQDAGFEKVTQEQLESIFHTLLFAAIETSLSSLRWFLIYIFHYPEVQREMYQEIVNKVGLKRQTVADDKDNLPYVQAVFLEVHRLASIVPLNVPHKAIVNTSVIGHHIPKDTQVLFNLYSMHYDPTHWDEPEKFKPERWLNADGSLKKEKATHYLPFSAGVRGCLGERMAKMQMFLIVTRLLVNFEVSLAPGESMPDLKAGIMGLTYAPASKFKIVLSPRDRK